MATQEKAPHAVRRRVVLFPLPFQGHLSPMLQLAELLRARGLAVTVLHTDFNAPDPARHPEFAFVPIHEALPDAATSPDADIVAQLLALNTGCEAPFREALAELLRLREDVACVVVDGQWYAALGAARALGVPVLTLRTDSAATFRSLLAFPRLRDAGYVPIKEERRDEQVPGLEPLRVRDLIRIDGSDVDALCGFIARVADAVRASASGVVLNSFDAIEAPELARIQSELSCPAFAVGPLHRMSPAQALAEHGLHEPDRGCMAWLDTHPPRSVLYVSLGSVACVDRAAFEEMAWGLAGSGVPFLWVVRPGSVRGGADELPSGLDEEARSRGKVVAWAPQLEVLAHEAVGAFWTHCGWNSTLESVCAGVPMLAQPCFADQTVNARYVTHRWGVGLEVGDVMDRARVAERVRMVMVVDDIKTFVYEGPHSNFAMDFDDDDDEDEEDQQEDESDTDTAEFADEAPYGLGWDEPESPAAAPTEQADVPQEVEIANPMLGFPRMARLRCNLTAMSQRYNVGDVPCVARKEVRY